jgi:exonuclease III
MIMDKSGKQGNTGQLTEIHTFNVRGIRDAQKRSRLFCYFRNFFKGIIMLQETYSVSGDREVWGKEWGNDIVISSGSIHSRGVAILLPKGMEYEITECMLDDNGRYILLVGNFNGHEMALLNIYAPTADKCKE